jgi:predicted dithiol-disulfide oxidoreductase (DUF899 family)
MKVVSGEEWTQARKALLAREKEFSREREALARARRDLPWEEVTKDYAFDGPDGKLTLPDLFGDCSQLVIYHFMFPPEWDAGCPHCSFWADSFNGVPAHLRARDVSFAAVSRAPIGTITAYKQRMGWSFPWVSAGQTDFNYDFGASFTEEQQPEIAKQVLPQFANDDAIAELAASCGTDVVGYVTTEAPGLNAFALEDGVVYHTYAADPREVGFMVFYEQLLERAPKGGKEGVPVSRHDEYKTATRRAACGT